MEQISKAFTGIVLIVVLTFVGVGIISAAIDASHAEQYASDAALYIEAANFSESVTNLIKQTAETKGYTVEVTYFDTDNDGWNNMAEVKVLYDYTISVLNVTGTKHTAKAYAS